MANSAGFAYQFKVDLFNGIHAFGTTVTRGGTTADTFKAALFLASGSLSPSATSTYSTTSELAGTGNYTQGGVTMTWNAPAQTSGTAYLTPTASFSWTTLTSSGAFDCCQIYNSTQSSKTVGLWTFSSQSITAGNFSLTMPTNDSSTGLIRLT